ncbi:MAG TPA: PilZ domain-containing protein, partial [Sandaracinaceae bacterium]
VRVRRSNGTAIDGRTEDISEGGLLVLLDAELEPREPVLVRFALPASGRMVSVPAQARWARESRASTRAVGLAFVDAGEKVLEDIRAYVAYLGQ